jgi:N-methylhydantoinase A
VIALINAYRNPAHERRAREIVERAAPGLPVFCSTEVWAVIREYERTTTAVIHGYVQPRVSHYLDRLQASLREISVPAEPMVTKSNGGVMSAELGKTACAQMILSGTAAGVIGASYIAGLSGFPKTMSLDIGGTSADVAFIEDGMPQYGVGEMIGEFPIYIPTVAVSSIGAGGGSIAHVDELGVLKVGPESAGSTPGPACYARGGTRPTITDAFAVLGYLGSGELGYSAISVDVGKARVAIDRVARPTGMSLVGAADAIIRIAVSGMYMEVSKLVSRYGIDPRDYSLQAFGGAGPMMACFLAREIGMRHVVVPPTPGVLSALGGLIADIKNDFISTLFVDLDAGALDRMRAGYAELERAALRWLREEQGYAGEHSFLYSADMRYQGQSYEIETMLDAGEIRRGESAAIGRRFHERHRQVYDHADPEAPIQVINLRLVVVGRSPKPAFPAEEEDVAPASSKDVRRVFIDGTERDVPIFERSALRAGAFFTAPAIVVQSDCTTCIPPGFSGRVDAYGNLILQLEQA